VALGWTHHVMGWCLTFVGAGSEELALALDHFLRAGDLNGQGWAHQIAALAYAMMGDWAEPAAQSEQALALFRQAGDQTGQAWVTAAT
jgi:hypothetical protein